MAGSSGFDVKLMGHRSDGSYFVAWEGFFYEGVKQNISGIGCGSTWHWSIETTSLFPKCGTIKKDIPLFGNKAAELKWSAAKVFSTPYKGTPTASCSTNLNLELIPSGASPEKTITLKWNAVVGAKSYTVWSNKQGHSPVPTFEKLRFGVSKTTITFKVDDRYFNEFFVRADPSSTLRCSDKNIRKQPTSQVVNYPLNPCISSEYNHSVIHGFTMCMQKSITAANMKTFEHHANLELGSLAKRIPKAVNVLKTFRIFGLK